MSGRNYREQFIVSSESSFELLFPQIINMIDDFQDQVQAFSDTYHVAKNGKRHHVL